jgi:peptidoglycan hydrolase CwlO-like protein
MKMNKKVVLGIGASVLGLSLAFGGGIVATHATTDWKTDAINSANSNLGATGYNEKTKLVNSASTDINNRVQDEIGKDVQDQQAQLQALLDQYYQDKLNGITDTAEFKDLEAQIVQIKENILARYKTDIDNAFTSQTTTN